MSFLISWYHTELPKDIIEILSKDIDKFDSSQIDSSIGNINGTRELDKSYRHSRNCWISTNHWFGGFLWYYIQRTNRENFLYDLTTIDNESLQYTEYGPGQYYNWHIDQGIDSLYKPTQICGYDTNTSSDFVTIQGEYVRKLSFSLQLSGPEDYTGGELQFLSPQGKTFFAPKQRGTLIMFDSRTHHRVHKVKSGMRKSLVGWVVGPRWK